MNGNDLKKQLAEAQKHIAILQEELNRTNSELLQLTLNLEDRATELKYAYERLKEMDRLKNMFISTMSHELRTPLNSIIGFSSIMLDEWIGPLNEEQKKNLATVHRSGQHLLALINDVIDISKIEAGMVATNMDEFDLYDVISEAVNSLLPQIKDKGLEIVVEAMHQPMRTDRRRLLQSVLNFLSNAVKFTERGRIFVGAGLAPARNGQPQGLNLQEIVEITVSDTGIGIKEEDMPKLFQSFIRIDSPLRAKVGGTGLGLYLTKKLITEILKGEISVSSRYEEGSRFVMRIPWRLQ